MTLGTPLPASMRAVEPSRVLKVTVEVFHTLAAMAPQVSATVGAAALERMDMLRNATAQPLEPAMFVIGPRARPGSARLRQLPPSQPDSLRTPRPRRSCRCCTHRRWSRRSRPLSGGGAARRHAADCPDDACRCHGRWTDGRAKPGALRRGDRGRRAGGSDGGGQRRLRGPADGADRVLRPRRAGRHLDPDRELHGVPIRRLRGRAREPGAATGEAAGR